MINLKLSAKIARTHLLSRKKQSTVAALGVTFGIAMFIAMMGFMTGVNKLLEDTMLSATPHVHIYNDIQPSKRNVIDEVYPDKYMKVVYHQQPSETKQNLHNGFQIADFIRKDPRVYGVSPLLTSQVFYNYGPTQINGTVAGVDIVEEDKLYEVGSKMVAGKIEDLLSASNGIIMGIGLANKLNVWVGDKVNITTPAGVQINLKIVGIMEMGIGLIDDSKSYSTLATAQKILQKDNRYITDINVKLNNLDLATSVAQEYNARFGYKAEDWATANATILVSFTLRNAITFAVVIALLTVAGFGIYNIMNMTIYEKMKDIAILKATGFAGGDVTTIFMIEAMTLGLAGALIGITMGYLMCLGISHIPFHAKGMINMNSLPMNFDPKYYVMGIVFGILTTAIAGWMPSRKAAKIDPVEIIRG